MADCTKLELKGFKLLYTFFAQIRFQAKGEETHREGGVFFLIFSEKNQKKNTSLSMSFFSGMKTSLFQKVYSNLKGFLTKTINYIY